MKMNVAQKTVLVGAGVVNLVTAYYLSKQNHELIIVDKAPSPISKNANWKNQGCTFGGENVRMYTYTEADNYNEKGSQLYANMGDIFEKPIVEGGWLVNPASKLNEAEKAWTRDFKAVTPQEANQFAEDIYNVNISSGTLWDKMMKEDTFLFEDVDFLPEILRIYSEKADFEAAQKLHRRLGSFKRTFDVNNYVKENPVFQHALATDMFGGCMITEGFTLKVQDFCLKIIKYLENKGVDFWWEHTFEGIDRDDSENIRGIKVDGELYTFKNYVLSPGAYSGTSLKGTSCANHLHGVLGVWLTIPNVHPEIKHSMKIHKTGHVGEDTNITLIEDEKGKQLVLGSGYGYTGNATKNHARLEQLEDIFESLKHTAQTYYPDAYEAGKSYIDDTKKYCVRSWTPTGLGVFEVQETFTGKLIITGGNNTGGFTQSPYIAEAVVKTINEKEHPMQALFYPARGMKKRKQQERQAKSTAV
ncbi:MAG: FAD-dependent oxidoreductase [Saprospiraceae bacterium]